MSQVLTSLDGVQIKLSNLEKVLWPDDGVTKAELIQFYLSIYPFMNKWINNRPLTLIRYPEGIYGNKFYSKNAPDFTPSWIQLYYYHDIKYVSIQKSADLIYVANLASLEIHSMTISCNSGNKPDTIIFDLDPSEGFSFEDLKILCLEFSEYLKSLGYHPHIKTSGSKGLHIYVPIIPQYSQEEVFNTSKVIGQEFTELNKNTTLKISKESRQGKILIDIYRNHQSQTCVAPLSTRAKKGVPVSMPIIYEDLNILKSSDHFNIKNALEYLNDKNPWESYSLLQSKLHNIESDVQFDTNSSNLSSYKNKRNFDITNEPVPEITNTKSESRYVIQLHNATNLHYDLRIEENGVLTSWAIPKSLPTQKGIKRLAIKTEDHPLKYLDFEGEIPKGEYGGGKMWIFDNGNFVLHKKEEKSYQLSLINGDIKGDFALYHTKDNQWIIELKSDDKQLPKYGFMLAEQLANVPSANDYFFELKWDGIRVHGIKNGPIVKLLSKSGRDISEQFPEVIDKLKDIDAEVAIVDGELVCLDKNGIPVFANIISRMHTKSKILSQSAVKSNPTTLYLFDITYLDGKSCLQTPIERRREWLSLIVKKSEALRISEIFDDGESLFQAAKEMGLEGIIAKRKRSLYNDKRSYDWIKIKVRTLIDLKIIGYTKGKGDRASLLGSIHTAKMEEGKIIYMGKVGTGFDDAKLKEIYNLLIEKKVISKPITEAVEEEYNSIWIEDGPMCEVQYASLTPSGTMREPVFYRIKIDE